MKKLSFGKSVEIVDAICDWCLYEKDCFESTSKNNHTVYAIFDYTVRTFSEGGGFFSSPKTSAYWVGDPETKKYTVKSHVCADCAKQMVKHIKK